MSLKWLIYMVGLSSNSCASELELCLRYKVFLKYSGYLNISLQNISCIKFSYKSCVIIYGFA